MGELPLLWLLESECNRPQAIGAAVGSNTQVSCQSLVDLAVHFLFQLHLTLSNPPDSPRSKAVMHQLLEMFARSLIRSAAPCLSLAHPSMHMPSGYNARYEHTLADEDQMRFVKGAVLVTSSFVDMQS